MNILILSCNTGGGHNSAAKAIKNYFDEKNHTCTIADALAFWSEEKSRLISNSHIFIYRNLPSLFGICYRHEENHRPKDGNESLIYKIVYNGCKGLAKHLTTTSYDAVICTHAFPAMMLTKLKKEGVPVPRSYFVATDYTCSPGVEQTLLDTYFIPHSLITDEFVGNGMPAEQIIPSGIPINPVFYDKLTKSEAKLKLHLPENKRLVILSCGSMGCGPIKFLAETMPEKMPDDIQLAVICGSNRRLYNSLTKKALYSNVKIIGFTTRMNLYMDAADLILTKPGGLTITEAAIKQLPMVFIDAVPGCETRNIEFFTNNNMAGTRKKEDELIELVIDYLTDDEILKSMSYTLSQKFNFNSLEIIYDKITSDCK